MDLDNCERYDEDCTHLLPKNIEDNGLQNGSCETPVALVEIDSNACYGSKTEVCDKSHAGGTIITIERTNECKWTQTDTSDTYLKLVTLPVQTSKSYQGTQTDSFDTTDVKLAFETTSKETQTDQCPTPKRFKAFSTTLGQAIAVSEKGKVMMAQMFSIFKEHNLRKNIPAAFEKRRTQCNGTQTDTYDILANKLWIFADEIARIVTVFDERMELCRLRSLVDNEQRHVNIADLMDAPAKLIGTCKAMHNDLQKEASGLLFELVNDMLKKRSPSCQNRGDKMNTSDASNHDNQSTSEIPQWNDEESAEVSTLMSWLRYGADIRRKRIDMHRELDIEVSSRGKLYLTVITIGSKADGITGLYEGVWDCVYLLSGVVCIEEDEDYKDVQGNITVFRMKTSACGCGYCMLLLMKRGTNVPAEIASALCDAGCEGTILSSEVCVAELKSIESNQNGTYNVRTGPHTFRRVVYTQNHMLAIQSVRPKVLKRWAGRSRHWPPLEVVQKVVSLEAFVTPVGMNGSESSHVEWRIDFYKGETELVRNLNDTQGKLYVILKMIIKDVLKPQTTEITSYMVKNIVFWLAEKNPQSLFHERGLLYWVREGLEKLRTSIETQTLPHYVIPERNLMMSCNMENKQQHTLISTITGMIDEGPRMILKLKKIRQIIISHPEPFIWYNRLRTELEILVHAKAMIKDENMGICGTDHILQQLWVRQSEIEREVLQRLNREGSDVQDVHEISIRMLS